MTNRLILLCIAIFWAITLTSGPDTKDIFERNQETSSVSDDNTANEPVSVPRLKRTELTNPDRSKYIWKKGGHFQNTDFVLHQAETKKQPKSVHLDANDYVNPARYDYRRSYYQHEDYYVDSWGYDSGYNFLDEGAVEPVFNEINDVPFLSSRVVSAAYTRDVFAKHSLAKAPGQASKQVSEPGLLAILGAGFIAVGFSKLRVGKSG